MRRVCAFAVCRWSTRLPNLAPTTIAGARRTAATHAAAAAAAAANAQEANKAQANCASHTPPSNALATNAKDAVVSNHTSSSDGDGDGVDDTAQARQWQQAMELKYGPGTFALFRALYKELCDELRHEYYTKPPPPLPPTTRTLSSSSSSYSELCEDGSWSVEYRATNNLVVFRRAAVPRLRMGRVTVYATVAIADPPQKNVELAFVDWFPFEVLIEHKGVVLHYAIAATERMLYVRNLRVYEATSTVPDSVGSVEDLMSFTDDAIWRRHNLRYDGPCFAHLELTMQSELYDVLQDHGMTMDWLYWATQWVFYYEHVVYVRWMLQMLDHLIPPEQRGGEDDFLRPHEKAMLDEPAEEWLEAHAL